jgi:hypothetical protein
MDLKEKGYEILEQIRMSHNGQVAGSGKHGNLSSISIKAGNFFTS